MRLRCETWPVFSQWWIVDWVRWNMRARSDLVMPHVDIIQSSISRTGGSSGNSPAIGRTSLRTIIGNVQPFSKGVSRGTGKMPCDASGAHSLDACHSHSIVAGGLLETSYTT